MTGHINSQSDDEIPKSLGNTCCVCYESIEIGAKKCVHCESYQDWRRYLNLSSTMLALIVALVSVLSISIPILKENFKSNNSKINILFQSDSIDNLTFIASNSGNRPGGIGNVSMRIDGRIEGIIKFTSNNAVQQRRYIFREPLDLDAHEYDKSDDILSSGISPFFLSDESRQIIVGSNKKIDLIDLIDLLSVDILEKPECELKLKLPQSQSISEGKNCLITIEPPAKCIFTFKIINFDSTIDNLELSMDCAAIHNYLGLSLDKL